MQLEQCDGLGNWVPCESSGTALLLLQDKFSNVDVMSSFLASQISILGGTQRYYFPVTPLPASNSTTSFINQNPFAVNNLELRNGLDSGYRFSHAINQDVSNAGTLTLGGFEGSSGASAMTWTYQNAGNINILAVYAQTNFSLTPTILGMPVATQSYVNSKTWLSSQITDFISAVRSNKLNQMAIPQGNINMNGYALTNTSTVLNINANTSGQLNIERLSDYPNDGSRVLLGNGLWGSINLSHSIGNVAASQIMDYPSSANAFLRGDGEWTLPYIDDLLVKGSVNLWPHNLFASNIYVDNVVRLKVLDPLGGYYPFIRCNAQLSLTDYYGLGTVLNASGRIVAEDFVTFSSLNIKNIEVSGEDIEQEALEILTKIPFHKYSYKDKVRHGHGSCFGVIAEHVKNVFPHCVTDDEAFVPNILQECFVKKISSDRYRLSFKEPIAEVGSDKLKLTVDNAPVEVAICKRSDFSMDVTTSTQLPSHCLAYGTYESCPAVAKGRLFELGLVVLKNLVNRVKKLEQQTEIYHA